MDFDWHPEQAARHAATRAAVAERFGAARAGFFSKDDWADLGKLGLLGLSLPARFGGGGLGRLDTAHQMEAFGYGCAETGLMFAAGAHLFACAMPIAEHGTEAARADLLPRLAAGEAVAGNAMTEAEAGSDVSRLAVTAVEVDGGWLLNGEKSFVSNGPVADVFVVYATTDPDAGHLGASAFAVDRDGGGVVSGPPFEKMGLSACPAGTVRFEDCFVPGERLLGEPGLGGAIFQQSMSWERTCLFAGFLGLLERVVEQSVAHARSRRQFGRRIGEFQAVAHRIADMHARWDSSRWLLYRACWLLDQGRPADREVALAKLAVSEAAVAGAADAVRVFGARGYLREDGVEAALRDSVPSLIFSGTSDIQRMVIGRELGL